MRKGAHRRGLSPANTSGKEAQPLGSGTWSYYYTLYHSLCSGSSYDAGIIIVIIIIIIINEDDDDSSSSSSNGI